MSPVHGDLKGQFLRIVAYAALFSALFSFTLKTFKKICLLVPLITYKLQLISTESFGVTVSRGSLPCSTNYFTLHTIPKYSVPSLISRRCPFNVALVVKAE